MTPKTRKNLQKSIGYTAFFLIAFGAMLHLTFPYAALGELIKDQARRSGIELGFGKLGPGFLGLKAQAVTVKLPKQEGQPAAAEPLRIDSISVRPTLLPPGLKFAARVFGGNVDGRIGAFSKRPKVVMDIDKVDLGRANAKAALGLDLSGRLDGKIDLELDPKDSSKIAGRVALNGDQLLLKGGTVANIDLPKVELGRLDAELQVEAGKATVKTFRSQGQDVESTLEGHVTLAQKIQVSPMQLQLKFKLADDFLKRNSFIQTGLNFAMARDTRGFYTARIERVLGNPKFIPVR